MHKLQLKRIYDPVAVDDGARVLTDRLWPRGVRKEDARLTLWCKDIAPSTALRQWFNHDAERWKEFQLRYRGELDQNAEAVECILSLLRKQTVTLLISARDPEHNHGRVLIDYLQRARRQT